MKSVFVLFFILSVFSGCTYYKVRTQLTETDNKVETIRKSDIYRYIVVHVGDAMWELKNPKYHGHDSISGELAEISSESKRLYYFRKISNRNSAVVPKRDRIYIDQVHVYVDMVNMRGSDVVISKDYIQRIDVFSLNVGATVASHTVVIAGSAIGAFGIFLAIVCNCPHIYTTDGESYTYSQSLYTGAVSPNLERHDYQLMPDYFKSSNTYDIILKNDLKEEQYTNMLELIVVEHELGDKIVPNQKGEFFSVSEAIAPSSAITEGKDDLLADLMMEDGNAYAFDRLDNDGFSNVYLEFNSPNATQNAQLVLTVKNSKWGGYVYNEFASLFGKSYAKRSSRRANLSREELEATMVEHGMPIQVSIKKNGEWIAVENIDLVGDVTYNTLAVNIPKELISSDKIEIRLKTGYMFWDIDYAGMDFSQKTVLTTSKHSAYEVTPAEEIVRSVSLAQDDKTYMEHLKTGDSAVLQFQNLPVNDQLERTIVMHSKGYYLDRKEYSGKMDRMALMRFRKEGELSRYSQELYQNQILQALSKTK